MKIETIVDSYWNGQHDQMREQIQKYGVKMFFYDLLPYMMDEADIHILRYKRIYGIYYKFRS